MAKTDAWLISYEDDGRTVIECNSMSFETLTGSQGERHVFQVPSQDPRDDGAWNIYIDNEELTAELLDLRKKVIIKTVTVCGDIKMACYEGDLTFWVKQGE